MDIAAGEYGYNLDDFHRLLRPVVDVLQADVTRCGGITGFMQVAALCEAHHIDLSGHCAPAVHLHVACAAPRLRHLEWFHDHVRIEHMLFDGARCRATAGSRRICRGRVSGSTSRHPTPSASGYDDHGADRIARGLGGAGDGGLGRRPGEPGAPGEATP